MLWLARPGESYEPPPEPRPTELGVQPLDLSGIFVCPRMAAYAGYQVQGVYYPSNHPLHPRLSVQPTDCFSNGGDAEVSGYSLAPTPPGMQMAEGVYFAPIDEVLAGQCKQAGKQLGFAVPCPSLLPVPSLGTGPPRCDLPYTTEWPCVYGGFVLSQQAFDVPPDYSELKSLNHGPHLVIAALSSEDLHQQFTERWAPFFCPGAYRNGELQTPGETFVRGLPAVYIECGASYEANFFGGYSMNEGHVVLQWTRQGVTYEVSLHGHTGVNRRLAQFIADHIEYVSSQ